MSKTPVLSILIFSAFCGSSLWFSGNAILKDLLIVIPDADFDVSDITSAVQLGFIIGTLFFSAFNIADRFPAGRVFLLSSVLGSFFNCLIVIAPLDISTLIISRCLTGFFLAGIYPVGIKIAALWCGKDLGSALGHFLAALVIGTAFPHLLNGLDVAFDWQTIVITSSALALIGGLLVGFVIPETSNPQRTPHHEGRRLLNIFKSKDFKASSSGYFGHMWELYTFWAFLPIILSAYNSQTGADLNVALWSFAIIASGSIGCSAGGLLSLKRGSAPVAFYQLATSCICCLAFPLMLSAPTELFLLYLCIWGITVAGDSPQFSTLNARTAPPEIVGSAVTLVICIGFSLTIVSLHVFEFLMTSFSLAIAVSLMAIGPLYGIYALHPLKVKNPLFK
ncbi:MAG: MFS transporter [Cycloclasticus sp.]